MLRLLILATAAVCFYARDAYGRNETVHACELVIKCFEEADVELLRCQSILSDAHLSSSISNEATGDNDTTTVEPTTVAASDDCMESVKQKMQQKRALVEQRAQAFALCLTERMGRGPEDVDPRKYRYCNTVISRYNARTTISTPPEFTLVTTPASAESSPPAQRITNGGVATSATKRTTQQPAAAGSSSASSISTGSQSRHQSSPSTASGRSSISSPRPPLPPVRPRRQAPGANLQAANAADVFAAAAASNGSNGDIIRPPAAPKAGRRPELTTIVTEAVTTPPTATTNDPFDLTSTVASTQRQELPQQPLVPENEAGRIGAVARFSSGLSSAADKDSEREPAGGKSRLSPKSSTAVSLQSTPLTPSDQDPESASQSAVASPEVETNQPKIAATASPQPEQRTSPESLISPLPSVASSSPSSRPHNVSSPGIGPPAVSPSGLLGASRRALGSSPNGLNIQQSTPSLPDIRVNSSSSSLRQSGNDTLGAGSGPLVQQQEQAESGVLQTGPSDQPIVDSPQDFNPASPPSGPSSPGAVPASSTTSTTTTITTTAAPVSAGTAASNTVGVGTADEKQRNRVENLRESRRRVSEFKACMARARIKREECKPMVNCCPDSAKCHLRYELSELHDQIHHLELEISEGRQACLEKKKVVDQVVDALDQIDEEDLISDESIVSQQVF